MHKQTALLSVYHKEGITEFAQGLLDLGWDLLASGGTARHLAASGLPVRDVADLVGGQAILGHQVVTLSREIHAGLLARDTDEDAAELTALGIPRIDLVCVDLYPLAEAVASSNATRESVIEQTDIGGPTMLRSAAKGRRIVVADPADRTVVLEWLRADCPHATAFVDRLAAKAEFICADYSLVSAGYPDRQFAGVVGVQAQPCKYGENPWQTPAAFYTSPQAAADPLALQRFRLIKGAPLSYTNLTDVDRVLLTATHLAATSLRGIGYVLPLAVGVKHGNPCGLAVAGAGGLANAARKMVLGDPVAIFGGVVLCNEPVDAAVAEALTQTALAEGQKKRILDVVIAPSFTAEAIKLLKRPKGACRFLVNPALADLSETSLDRTMRLRPVRGGFLSQPNYTQVLDLKGPDIEGGEDLRFTTAWSLGVAWAAGCTSNSNTITLAKQGMLIGNGCGQMSRVIVAEHAIAKARAAGHDVAGSVAYSDSFFPFTDGPELLCAAGIEAILTCRGSRNDEQVFGYFRERGVQVVTRPVETGRGFFGH